MRKGGKDVKITKNTGELAAGTVVLLPDGETLIIRGYCEATERYLVQFVELDADDIIATSEERYIGKWELIGAEI